MRLSPEIVAYRTFADNFLNNRENSQKIRPLQCSISFDISRRMADRTALLISCSAEEARAIRERAKLERRAISGYMLNILMRALEFEERILAKSTGLHRFHSSPSRNTIRPAGPRTAILLRCLKEESERIRRGAKMRDTTISGFVLHSLRRSWDIAEKVSESLHHKTEA